MGYSFRFIIVVQIIGIVSGTRPGLFADWPSMEASSAQLGTARTHIYIQTYIHPYEIAVQAGQPTTETADDAEYVRHAHNGGDGRDRDVPD